MKQTTRFVFQRQLQIQPANSDHFINIEYCSSTHLFVFGEFVMIPDYNEHFSATKAYKKDYLKNAFSIKNYFADLNHLS